ncbi:MAG: glucosamine-6-phosphate deaminase [Fretibacterium sp.]|nr:glucosamine-6-phosphate deaminase [Fretibacterium sp.]
MLKKIITENHDESCELVARMLVEPLARKGACLGLATGGTMEGVYSKVRSLFVSGGLSFKSASTVNLDEYVGLEPSHEQSYRAYMNRNLFDHIDIDKAHTYIPKGTDSPEKMLRDFRRFLDEYPRDIQLLGVGTDGHIGFNEPASCFLLRPHIVELDAKTRADNARFFSSPSDVPLQAITMGVGDILEAAKVVLLAYGESKVFAIRELFLHDRVDPQVPCTALKLHSDATVVLSRNLADLAGV